MDAPARIARLGSALAAGETTLRDAAGELARATGAARVSLTTVDRAAGTFHVRLALGRPCLVEGTRFSLETSTHFTAAVRSEPFVAPDFGRLRRFDRPCDRIVKAQGLASGLCLPLGVPGSPVGGLSLHWTVGGSPAERAAALVLPVLGTFGAALAQAAAVPAAPPAVEALVCHDDPLVGRGLVKLLEERGAARARLCASLADVVAASWLQPADVLVADAVLEGRRVDAWLQEARAAGVTGRLLVVSSWDTRENLAAAAAAGAVGYIARDRVERLLPSAVEAAAHGRHGPQPRRPVDVAPGLTPRELDVLALLDRGLRLAEVAGELGIALTTVKTHSGAILRKLGARTRAEATFEARRQGLLR